MPPKKRPAATAATAEATARPVRSAARVCVGTPQKTPQRVRKVSPRAASVQVEQDTTASVTGKSVTATDLDLPVVCPVCERGIIDATDTEVGEDAIFCDGQCKCWYHRYCACLPKQEFMQLKDAETPFYCPRCNARRQEIQISELKATVHALGVQVEELRLSFSASSLPRVDSHTGCGRSVDHMDESSTVSKQQWNKVTRKGNKESGKGGVKQVHSMDSARHKSRNQPPKETKHVHRTQVNGARKVWGTMRGTTKTAVENTLHTLTKIPKNSLVIKRKYRTAQDNSNRVTRWWFVLRGEEEILAQLQEEWPVVALQTAWKLQPLFHNSATTVMASNQLQPSTVCDELPGSTSSTNVEPKNVNIVHQSSTPPANTQTSLPTQQAIVPEQAPSVSTLLSLETQQSHAHSSFLDSK